MGRKHKLGEAAARNVISAVQRSCGEDAGIEQGGAVNGILNRVHDIHQAIILGSLGDLLAGRTIREYIGADWVSRHRGVERAIRALEAAIQDSRRGTWV